MPIKNARISIITERPLSQPEFEDTIRESAELVRAEWVRVAKEFSDTGRYANSIQITHLHRYGAGAWVAVIEALSPYSLIVDYGRQGFNLATKINWDSAEGVRISKSGRPYIVVPFRHYAFSEEVEQGAEGSRTAQRQMMPRDVYQLAQQLERTYFKGGSRTEVTYAHDKPGRQKDQSTGRFLEERFYQWGGRLRDPLVAGTKFESMYKIGGKGQTHYGTFRTITPDSVWMIPSFSGHRIAERAMESAADKVAQLIGEEAQMRISVQLRKALP